MSNPELEKPTVEQEESVGRLMDLMSETSLQNDNILKGFQRMRRALNDSRGTLGRLKEVIGKQAYMYNERTSWHSLIDDQVNEIDKALK